MLKYLRSLMLTGAIAWAHNKQEHQINHYMQQYLQALTLSSWGEQQFFGDSKLLKNVDRLTSFIAVDAHRRSSSCEDHAGGSTSVRNQHNLHPLIHADEREKTIAMTTAVSNKPYLQSLRLSGASSTSRDRSVGEPRWWQRAAHFQCKVLTNCNVERSQQQMCIC